VTRHGLAAEGADLEAADLVEVAISVVAADSVAVALAAERSIPAPEDSAVGAPRNSVIEGWVLRDPAMHRCGLRFSNPILPQGRPGLITG